MSKSVNNRWQRWLGQMCSDERYIMLSEATWAAWLRAVYNDLELSQPALEITSDSAVIKNAWRFAIDVADAAALRRLDILWLGRTTGEGNHMRKTQCLFCTSRRCSKRIVTPDMKYDQVACVRHGDALAEHADATLRGALRCNLQSSATVKRGDPYPA